MRAEARVVSGVLAGLAYIAGSHWLMTAAPASPWNAFALLAPMLGATAWCAWRTRQRSAGGLASALLAALAIQAAVGPALPQSSLFLGQHVMIHLALAAWFGFTLRRGAQALISSVAQRVHGALSAEMASYTRKLTLAWSVYFVAMAGVSLALYFTAPFEVWAVFANWLTPLALGLMFGAEYLLRYRLHPRFERISMRRAIQAYAQRQAPAAPTHAAHLPDRQGRRGAAEPR